MALASIQGLPDVTYHMNDMLMRKWDKIKDGKLKKMDNDKIYIVDGRERTGKSTFALQQACYIDPTLIHDIKRICFSADEFLEAIRNTDSDDKVTKCIVFDEAFRGLSSRGAMSKVNKKIITALMEVGQKNLVIFIVLPSFFMLDLYAAMLRSNALFHVALDKRNAKRVFYVYPHKKKGYLYQSGVRKGWSYDIRTKNKGYFYNSFPAKSENEVVKAFYTKYLAKKRSSLVESEDNADNTIEHNEYMIERNITWVSERKSLGLNQREYVDLLNRRGIKISPANFSIIEKELADILMKREAARSKRSEIMEKLFNNGK